MRAVIYARYSTDMQSETSVEDQVRQCRERAERDGHEIVEVFNDYAISGSTLSNRPGMVSLMAAARASMFDLVYAEALDRISRDQKDIAAIFKRLNHADVSIFTLSEGLINKLHVGLKGTMNALFLKDLAIKTRRGQRGRVEAGKIPGGNSYGYKIVRSLKEDGTITTGEREINQEQAAIIKRIYNEYAAGASTINGSRQRRNSILNNELYLGRITYNRQRFIKDPETGKRNSRLNPEHEWIITDVPALRIVDDDTWSAVQAIKERYSSQQGNKRQAKKRLLTGLVKCGACGGAMTIVNRVSYYCSAKCERGTCDTRAGIKVETLEEPVLSGLKDILLDNDDLIDAFTSEFNAEITRLRQSQNQNGRHIQKDLNQVTASIKRCIAFITGGDGDPGLVRDELQALEAKKRQLEHAINSLKNERTIEVHPNMAELYRKKVSDLQTLLTEEHTKPEAVDAIRSMIHRIEVHASGRRGDPDVLLVGALASILAYATQTKTAASIKGDGCRVLIVTGVGLGVPPASRSHVRASPSRPLQVVVLQRLLCRTSSLKSAPIPNKIAPNSLS